jgi:hypothetical protein
MKEARITINFTYNDKLYSVHYMPSYWGKVYQGHRYERIVQAQGLVENSIITDKSVKTLSVLEGNGIEMEKGFIAPKIMGAMVYVEEVQMLFPHWIIKTVEED